MNGTPLRLMPTPPIPLEVVDDGDEIEAEKYVPTSSPTDFMLSPCSRKILRKKPFNQETAKGRKRIFSLHADIPKKLCPLPSTCPLILGSSSLNRKSILEFLGWKFSTMIPDIDEKAIRGIDYFELPRTIATAKAAVLIQRLQDEGKQDEVVVLTSDQIVLFEGAMREKPDNEEEALVFLSSYSNKSVSTISAVVATHFPSGRQETDVSVATVHWQTISEKIVRKVVGKGEIFSSAGGFRIEDPDLNPLIRSIDGTMDSVMGMPILSTVKVLEAVWESAVINDESGEKLSSSLEPSFVLDGDS